MSPSIINSTSFYHIAVHLFWQFANVFVCFFLFVCLFVLSLFFYSFLSYCYCYILSFLVWFFFAYIYFKKVFSSSFYLHCILRFCPKLYYPAILRSFFLAFIILYRFKHLWNYCAEKILIDSFDWLMCVSWKYIIFHYSMDYHLRLVVASFKQSNFQDSVAYGQAIYIFVIKWYAAIHL